MAENDKALFDKSGQAVAAVEGQIVNGEAEMEPQEPDALTTEKEPTSILAPIERDMAQWKAETQAAIEIAQARIEFNEQVRRLIAGNVRKRHWKRFGDKVRPDGSECIRLRKLLGVAMEISPPERHDYEDEDGKYYVYVSSGWAQFGPERMPCFGSASSRTKFFSIKGGKARPPREINPSFISRMAWMEAFKDGIRTLFALDLDPDEVEGITGKAVQDAASGFGNKDKSGDDTPELHEQRKFIANKCLELAGGEEATAGQFLCFLTTFVSSKDNRIVKGKNSAKALTAKQVANIYRRQDKDLSRERYLEFAQSQAEGHDDHGNH